MLCWQTAGCGLTVSVCRGCECDVIICTWEGQNVGGLLREREREKGENGGRLMTGMGGAEEPCKMLQYLRLGLLRGRKGVTRLQVQ